VWEEGVRRRRRRSWGWGGAWWWFGGWLWCGGGEVAVVERWVGRFRWLAAGGRWWCGGWTVRCSEVWCRGPMVRGGDEVRRAQQSVYQSSEKELGAERRGLLSHA